MNFILPVRGLPDNLTGYEQLVVETRGLLSTTGGAISIMWCLGKDCVVDIGTWLTPFIFKCQAFELESLRQLLEENLQHGEFDCFQSALVVSKVIEN